jgi:hypothetical protein
MMTNNKTINWVFWFWWLLINILGFAIAGLLFHNFPFAFSFPPNLRQWGEFEIGAAIFGGLAFGVVPALPIGFGQWMILRRYFHLSRWWIVSTPLGIGLLHFLNDGFPNAYDQSAAVLVSGLLVGILQWNLIRPAINSSAKWWIVASVLGWSIGWLIGLLIFNFGELSALHYSQKHGLLGITMGLGYSLSTGLVLRFLARRNQN